MASDDGRKGLGLERDCSAALRVPCLPPDAPAAPTPADMLLPLRPHQQRALHRCLLIERDGSLRGEFGVTRRTLEGEVSVDYTSRGGVLADQVGMGKTATALALALASEEPGPTLVIAPSHLLHQWADEARKFVRPDAIPVIVGADALAATPASKLAGTRALVLVDVQQAVGADRLWYDFRRVFREPGARELCVSEEKRALYRACAGFCVKSPKGPCSYTGWVYTGALFEPAVPWRRVVFDEVQDLVREGSDSQKCLLQLTRTARSVWLLSATPFPHGNASVHANHELLGLTRLRLDVEQQAELPDAHPFEAIKRKLYIRSPGRVRAEAVEASARVEHATLRVETNEIERHFYQAALAEAREHAGGAAPPGFGAAWEPLRQLTCHPEASAAVREAAGGDDGFSSVGLRSFARRTLDESRTRARALKIEAGAARDALAVTERSHRCAAALLNVRASGASVAAYFGGGAGGAEAGGTGADERVRLTVHDLLCPDAERCAKRRFTNPAGLMSCKAVRMRRVLSEEARARSMPEFLVGGPQVEAYVRQELGADGALQHYAHVTAQTADSKRRACHALEAELQRTAARAAALDAMLGGLADAPDAPTGLELQYGAKPAALVRFLRELHAREPGAKTIVFSMWHDVLRLVFQTLRRCGLRAAILDGGRDQLKAALDAFCEGGAGGTDVLLMSAKAKASGANLQVATHVVLLDPAGLTAEHGAALEAQAIGRAVRMGQERAVTVTRFCVGGTLEPALIEQIGAASRAAEARADDGGYVCEAAGRALPPDSGDDADADSSEVEIVLARTAEEREGAKWREAEAKGAIVEVGIGAEDDEAELESTPDAGPGGMRACADHQPAEQPAAKRVKLEPQPLPSSEPAAPSPDHAPPPPPLFESQEAAAATPEVGPAGTPSATLGGTMRITIEYITPGPRGRPQRSTHVATARADEPLATALAGFERRVGWAGGCEYWLEGAGGKRRSVRTCETPARLGIGEYQRMHAGEVIEL